MVPDFIYIWSLSFYELWRLFRGNFVQGKFDQSVADFIYFMSVACLLANFIYFMFAKTATFRRGNGQIHFLRQIIICLDIVRNKLLSKNLHLQLFCIPLTAKPLENQIHFFYTTLQSKTNHFTFLQSEAKLHTILFIAKVP